MDSLIELKEHEDLSLAEEADRNWVEVIDQTYTFNRKRREVSKIQSSSAIFSLFFLDERMKCHSSFFTRLKF